MPRQILHPTGTLLLLGLLLTGSFPAAAQPQAAQQYFDAGNEHYAQGRYERAVDAYHDALETGYASGPLYYNLGNAYLRSGQLGRSILYYEKARRLLPDYPPLEHSLDVARRRADVPSPAGEDVQDWHVLVARINPSTSFAFGLFLYLLGTGFLGYRLWTGTAIGRVRLLAYAALTAGFLLILGAWSASYAQTLDRRVVVTTDEVPLHASPTRQAARDTTLREGAVLEHRRRQPSWTEVYLDDGHTGWLPAHAVEKI